MKSNGIQSAVIQQHGASTTLVVLLHAINRTSEQLVHIRKVVETIEPDADILAPNLPFSYTSRADPSEVIADLLVKIDEAYEKSQQEGRAGYQHILLIGHSMGALFARKLYVCACGENPEAPFERTLHECILARKGEPLLTERPWAAKVDRIILLAAMNRGWAISRYLSISNAIALTIAVIMGRIYGTLTGRMPIGFSVSRGAPFLTQLRLQWMFMRRQGQKKKSGGALTVQLLGTIDDLVAPNDNIDLVAGGDFIYLDVPRSGHKNVVEMDYYSKKETEQNERTERGRIFQKALKKKADKLKKKQLPEEEMILGKQEDITDVVFVIHGIRDKGYWTQKIARTVMKKGIGQGRKFASETSTFGYFPMISFVLPRSRRKKLEWLMDQYAESCARYPNATRFHYVGHSFGAYLLASALNEYPSCRFDNVVFAGSVVRRDYNWQHFIKLGQVNSVLNFVGSQDWVVAFFPKGLQSLNLQDLGSAGHDGFRERPEDVLQPNQYIRGGHSGAITESMWDAIANFLVNDPTRIPELPTDKLAERRSWYVHYPLWPIIWLAILVVIAGGFLMFFHLVSTYLFAACVLIYLFGFFYVVARV